MKLTRDAFCDLRNEAQRALRRSKETPSVLICAGTGCIAGGAMKIYENLRAECESRNLPVYIGLKHDTDEEKSLHVKMSGCHGFCEMGPLVHIEPMGIMYIHVKPEDCHEILEKTVLGGEIIDRLVYRLNGVAYPRQEDIPFYKKQHRVVLENCGTSDAQDIEEYIAKGGYSGFERALFEMTDEQICRDIIDSGLRGRGGGGVGLKGGVRVLQQQLLHLGQAAGKLPGDLLRPIHLVLRQGQLQLLGELFTDALQQQGGVVLRGQGHQRRVPEIGGKQQAADLLHQLDDRPAVRQAQAAAIQGGGAFRQGAAHGRGGFLDVLGIHKQASFPCVEKSKRQRMRHASSAAAFTRFSRTRQARAFWANHA